MKNLLHSAPMLTLLLLSDSRFTHFHPNCKYNSGIEMTHAWLGTVNRTHSVREHVAYVYMCAGHSLYMSG